MTDMVDQFQRDRYFEYHSSLERFFGEQSKRDGRVQAREGHVAEEFQRCHHNDRE